MLKKDKVWDSDPFSPPFFPRLKVYPCCPAPLAQWGRRRFTASGSCYCFQSSETLTRKFRYGWVCIHFVCVWGHTDTLVVELTAGAHIQRAVTPASGMQVLLGAGADWLLQFTAKMLHGWAILGSNWNYNEHKEYDLRYHNKLARRHWYCIEKID